MIRFLSDISVWILGLLSALLLCAALFLSSSLAFAKWNPLTSGISAEQVSEYHNWFLAQQQEGGGPCCGDEEHAGGDGHYVDVRAVGPNLYEVFVRELDMWVTYPKSVNAYHENPTGKNVAWYRVVHAGNETTVVWFCLRLANGT